MEQEERLCNEVKTVWEFTYFGDRSTDGGGCEAAVTDRARCGWDEFMDCSESLYVSRFTLRLKWAVYESYVRSAILYGSEAWCLKERWEFYEGQKDPWYEQCVEYCSWTEKDLRS